MSNAGGEPIGENDDKKEILWSEERTALLFLFIINP